MSTVPIKPFIAAFSDDAVSDLRDRLVRTRWPEPEPVDDWSQGAPLAYVQEVCAHWADGYDFNRVPDQLNAYEQGHATIDGLDIHFVHARSPEPDARPLVMTHGWPGTVVEFLDVLGPLSDPVAHGGRAEDAFHVVAPSLPGYGFSGRMTETGWGIEKTGAAWVQLMHALGYERFLAQGGDWGAIVTTAMGYTQAAHLDGIHVNLAICNPEDLLALGEPTEQEMEQLGRFQTYIDWENGYSVQQSTRPQTLGYGLTDSPAGQCAWIIEKFRTWTDNTGLPESAIDRDRLLDNITLYWMTGTATSSARMYWESFKKLLTEFPKVEDVPSAYTLFPHDVFTFTERWVRTRYTDLRYFNEVPEGGHFAAAEQPEIFVDEVRAAFRAIG